jgi:hypothetical protein
MNIDEPKKVLWDRKKLMEVLSNISLPTREKKEKPNNKKRYTKPDYNFKKVKKRRKMAKVSRRINRKRR